LDSGVFSREYRRFCAARKLLLIDSISLITAIGDGGGGGIEEEEERK